MAQLGARFHGMEEVESSNLSRSTNHLAKLALRQQWGLARIATGNAYLKRNAIVCEIVDAIGLPLRDFHFGMEASGDVFFNSVWIDATVLINNQGASDIAEAASAFLWVSSK